MSRTAGTSEATILSRVIAPDNGGMAPEAARSILGWKFPQTDLERMAVLSEKANAGRQSAVEQEELNDDERVGHLIGIAQSKARLSLKEAESLS